MTLRKNLFAALLCFCFWPCFGCCPVVAAERQILPINYWVIAYNNDLFKKLVEGYCNLCQSQTPEEREKYIASFTFPDAIDSDSIWGGMTVTDGEEIWGIVALPIKDENFELIRFDTPFFRAVLLSHPIIRSVFKDSNIRLMKQGRTLYLFSEAFSEETVNRIDPMLYWNSLARKAPIAYKAEYPEQLLLPFLPRESFYDPPFVKRIRESRKNGKVSQEESAFFGLRWDEDSWEFLWESTAAEETETAKERERLASFAEPFQVGGFCGSETGTNVSWRIVPEILFSGNTETIFRGGTVLVTPEKRVKNVNYHFRFTLDLVIPTGEEWKKDGTVLSDGSLHCVYPHQPEGVEWKEGIATPETLDALNRSLAENALAMFAGLRDSAMSTGGGQPIDFAAQIEDERGEEIYLALAFPPGLKPVDWESFQKTLDAFSEMCSIPRQDDEGNIISDENWQTHFQFSEPETYEGITYRKFEVNVTNNNDPETTWTPLFGVFGIGEDLFCLAFLNMNTPEDWGDIKLSYTEEEFATKNEIFQAKLKQKVQDSRRLQEEGMQTPILLVQGSGDGMRFRIEDEIAGRKITYRLKVGKESLNNVYTLAWQFGAAGLLKLLPFHTR